LTAVIFKTRLQVKQRKLEHVIKRRLSHAVSENQILPQIYHEQRPSRGISFPRRRGIPGEPALPENIWMYGSAHGSRASSARRVVAAGDILS